MEIIEKKVYMRRFKSKVNTMEISKYSRNLVKLIFSFLNVKELLRFLMVSKLVSKICLSFEILKKYKDVI